MNPNIIAPDVEQYCLGESFAFTATALGDADRIEWSGPITPAGGSLGLDNSTSANVVSTPTIAGTYEIEVCKFTSNAPANEPAPIQGPFLDCPAGVAQNEVFSIEVVDGDGCTITWQVIGATIITQSDDSASIQAGGGVGTINVQITCTRPDGSVALQDCAIAIYDQNLGELVGNDSQPLCVEVIDCEPECFCTSFQFTVIDCAPDCRDDYAGFNPKTVDKSPLEEDDCPEILAPVPLVGTKFQADPIYEILDPDCCDSCEVLRDVDRPLFMWNNVCSAPGWSVAGDAAFACDCNLSKNWAFTGSGTFAASGPSTCFVDVMVIKDHNILEGTVVTDPPAFGGAVDVGLCQDGAKIGGFLRPIVIPLDGGFDVNSASLTVTGTAVGGGPIQIGSVFIGQKLFLPDDLLPRDFQNPFDGFGAEFKVKQNDNCRQISRQMKPAKQSWSLTFEADARWINEKWKPFMRYLCDGNEGLFQPSRNNRPDEILCFDVEAVDPPNEVDCCYWEITISGLSYTCYPAIKA